MVNGEVAKHLFKNIGATLRKCLYLVTLVFNVLKKAIVDLTMVFRAEQIGLYPEFCFSTRWLNKGRSPDIGLSVITLDGQHVNDAVVNNGDIICLPRFFILIDVADVQVIV